MLREDSLRKRSQTPAQTIRAWMVPELASAAPTAHSLKSAWASRSDADYPYQYGRSSPGVPNSDTAKIHAVKYAFGGTIKQDPKNDRV